MKHQSISKKSISKKFCLRKCNFEFLKQKILKLVFDRKILDVEFNLTPSFINKIVVCSQMFLWIFCFGCRCGSVIKFEFRVVVCRAFAHPSLSSVTKRFGQSTTVKCTKTSATAAAVIAGVGWRCASVLERRCRSHVWRDKYVAVV